jgi:hypothetical protein
MFGIRSLAVVLVVAGCASSDPETARARQCAQARDHLLDLRLRGVAHEGAEIVAAHRSAITQAMGTDFLDRCGDLSVTVVNCTLAATDLAAASACSSN